MDYLIRFVKALVPEQYHPTLGEIHRIWRSFLYIGNRYICPCCGWRFRKLLPYGNRKRPNVGCPRCNSAERHRLLWLYLKNKTNLFSDNLKVLHFAPEYIFQKTLRFMSNLDYISVDLNSPLAMVKMNITNISYQDNTFDVILCSHVLEHVIDDRKAIRELFRVLKPGGWAILQVPILRDKTLEDPSIVSPRDRERIFGQKDHVRIYGHDYKDRLEEAGFTVKVDGYVRELGDDKIKKHGLSDDQNIYLCTKQR